VRGQENTEVNRSIQQQYQEDISSNHLPIPFVPIQIDGWARGQLRIVVARAEFDQAGAALQVAFLLLAWIRDARRLIGT